MILPQLIYQEVYLRHQKVCLVLHKNNNSSKMALPPLPLQENKWKS